MLLDKEFNKMEAAKQQMYINNMMQNLAIIFLAGQGGSYIIPEAEFNAVQNMITQGIVFEFKNINGELQVSLRSTETENPETNKSLN